MTAQPPTIATREQLIAYTTAAWQQFVAYVDGLSEAQWTGPKDAAGWSVKDHISHVTQWDRAVIALYRQGVPLQASLGIPDDAWNREDFDAMNEVTRQTALTASVPAVQAERDATWRDLVALMHELSDAQLARSGTEAELTVANRPIPQPVMQVLAEYWGTHYLEHQAHIEGFVAGEQG